jgi:hypothetical protein
MKELEKLIRERTLLKQLIVVNPAYKDLFSARISEIKMKINSEYAPIPNAEISIYLYQQNLAEDITKNSKAVLLELMDIDL